MTIKELKIRIKGVKSIQKITKAMQMVSASKLRFIQEKLIFANKFYLVVNSIISESKFILDKRDSEFNTFLLVTSDRGLCGSHSSSICKYYLGLGEKVVQNSGLVILGNKANELIGSLNRDRVGLKFLNIFKKGFDFIELVNISNKLLKLFTLKKSNSLEFIFNKYISSVKTEITTNIINFSEIDSKEKSSEKDEVGLTFFLLNALLYYSVCNSKASEESIRMQSMDNATSSANDLLDDLTRLYNMSRQVSITTELIEIVSGAESLKQGKN